MNHLGQFLEFNVTYGRYQGVKGQIGFDGFWKSPLNANIVIEVKTTEVYSVRTATLIGYINDLISEKQLSSWDNTLGLYVVGRPDPELRQLENAVLAEKRTDQLHIISVESLLSLAEMMTEYDISHEDILAVIRPSGPTIDTIVDLMARLVAGPTDDTSYPEPEPSPTPNVIKEGEPSYWLTPVRTDKDDTAEEVIRKLVEREHFYAFGERTPGRKQLQPGDWMCFYAAGKGIVAHARVATMPENKPHPKVRHGDQYPWTFKLRDEKLYMDNPIVIYAA